MFRKKFYPNARNKEEQGMWGRTRKPSSHTQWVAEPKYIDDDGRTHLHLGVLMYSVDDTLFESAIHADCGVNAADNDGCSALHIACRKGLHDCVDRLVKFGADMSMYDKYSLTPLMVAAAGGYHEVIKVLIIHGTNVNQSNASGDLALHYSCIGAHEKCTNILLKNKSKPNYPNNGGDTPLILACKSKNICILQALLDAGAKPDKLDSMKRSALHWASITGNKEAAQLLVDNDASLDDMDSHFSTPFLYSLMSDQAEIVQLLVEAGCDRTAIDGLNGTPLTLAALKGHDRCVKILLEAGEDPDEFSYFGMTALMAAVYEAHYDVATTLLEYGADVNIVSRLGFNSMVAALVHVNEKNAYMRHRILVMMLKYDIDINQSIQHNTVFNKFTNAPGTPMSLAISSGYQSFVRILLEAGSNLTSDNLRHIIKLDNTDTIFELSSIIQPIQEFKSKPIPLKNSCRLTIRNSLGTDVYKKVDTLPIPSAIKEYLHFLDMLHITPTKASVIFKIPDEVVKILDLRTCGLAAIKGSFLFQQVEQAVRDAAKPGPCDCDTCDKIRTMMAK